jgi:pimeloyl-ACP methyl ester carboxylesterase
MGRGQEAGSSARRFAAAAALRRGRAVSVRSNDGIRLHAEVFGPEDGYPIVLAHGITCAIRVWAYQIADLANDYRVIAYDHRGHGRSAAPSRRRAYSLDHLAGDLDSVLEATLAPGERAVIAGHSMGGIAIASWADRYPDRVPQRADAVALINTTTGDLLRNVQLLPVPPPLADVRVRAAGTLLKTFGAAPLLRAVDRPSRRFVSTIAVGRDADPAIAEFIYELFTSTPPAGRGGWARTLVDALGPEHIGLNNDGAHAGDRQRERPPAADGFVAPHRQDGAEPRLVRGALRRPLRDRRAPGRGQQAPADADRVGQPGATDQLLAGQRPVHLVGGALPRSHGAVEEAGPFVGGFGARPEDAVDRLA